MAIGRLGEVQRFWGESDVVEGESAAGMKSLLGNCKKKLAI